MTYLILALAVASVMFLIAVAGPEFTNWRAVSSLNLAVLDKDGTSYGVVAMDATLGTTLKFSITPKDGAGNVVDLVKFPAALTDIAWSVSDATVGSVAATADSLGVNFTPAAEGAATLTVTAKNVNGDVKTESIAITVKLPTPVVESLNLAAA